MLRAKEDAYLEEIMHKEKGERIVFETSYYQPVDKIHAIMSNLQLQANALAYQNQ